ATSLEAVLEGPVPPLDVSPVPDLNWVAMSQAALPPVTAGRFTVHGSHDSSRVPRGPNAILIEAGEAFGTAHHATTLGCLLAIDRLTRATSFRRVLDLGCGSGVLAIAASRALPKAQIFATDFDAQSVAVAAQNMRANGVDQRVALARAHGLDHHALRHAAPFDLVIANILAGPLCTLASDVDKVTRRGGVLVLSGILNSEAAGVTAAYRAHGFSLKEHRRMDGWSTLTFFKRG
ncbi:MAG: 50S ribosomal protein L11 methyltransferase, partial [Hyphomicrobium sp.]